VRAPTCLSHTLPSRAACPVLPSVAASRKGCPVGDGVIDDVPAWRSRQLRLCIAAQDLVSMFQRQDFDGVVCRGLVGAHPCTSMRAA
jgi:hypothetical protein